MPNPGRRGQSRAILSSRPLLQYSSNPSDFVSKAAHRLIPLDLPVTTTDERRRTIDSTEVDKEGRFDDRTAATGSLVVSERVAMRPSRPLHPEARPNSSRERPSRLGSTISSTAIRMAEEHQQLESSVQNHLASVVTEGDDVEGRRSNDDLCEWFGVSSAATRRAARRTRTSVGVELGLVELGEKLGKGVKGAVHCQEKSGGDGRRR